MKVLLAITEKWEKQIFLENDLNRIKALCELIGPTTDEKITSEFIADNVSLADIVITSWGTPKLDEGIINRADKLKVVIHGGGSVKPIVSDALWNKGIRVTTAAPAIGIGVAEFCLGLILTATKRAFWAGIGVKEGQWKESIQVFNGPHEIYRQTVGIIGAGFVGRYLIKLLKNFDCNIILYDPYCSNEDAEKLGVEKVDTLEELFSRSMVVSLNAPLTEETTGMIKKEHFEKLPDGALFINTARGAIIDEDGMIEELRNQRFVACLDVTDPEPPAPDSPLRKLPNVWLTPHEAGAVVENRLRIGYFVANEVESFVKTGKLIYEVKRETLARMG